MGESRARPNGNVTYSRDKALVSQALHECHLQPSRRKKHRRKLLGGSIRGSRRSTTKLWKLASSLAHLSIYSGTTSEEERMHVESNGQSRMGCEILSGAESDEQSLGKLQGRPPHTLVRKLIPRSLVLETTRPCCGSVGDPVASIRHSERLHSPPFSPKPGERGKRWKTRGRSQDSTLLGC